MKNGLYLCLAIALKISTEWIGQNQIQKIPLEKTSLSLKIRKWYEITFVGKYLEKRVYIHVKRPKRFERAAFDDVNAAIQYTIDFLNQKVVLDSQSPPNWKSKVFIERFVRSGWTICLSDPEISLD